MPVFWNPFLLWTSPARRDEERGVSPSTTATTTATTTAAAPTTTPALTQAGLFETGSLQRDGRLEQLRQTPPPRALADLESNDPRDKRVVYKQVSGRPVRLNHGAVIEGSVDFGGLQPNYVIDLQHPRLAALLAAARGLRGKDWADRVQGVVALVQKTLTEGAYDAPSYLKLLSEHRNQRINITLGDYLMGGAGVCRENALLTHLALLEANVDSEYLYCQAAQGGRAEDHAVALAVDDAGRKFVVDSYNRNFHGFLLDDTLKPGGTAARDKRLPGATSSPSMYGCTLAVAHYPTYWVPVRALAAPKPTMPPADALSEFRVVRPAPR